MFTQVVIHSCCSFFLLLLFLFLPNIIFLCSIHKYLGILMNLPDIIQFTAVQHIPLYTSSEPCSLFIHSTVDVPLGYFEFGAVVKNAAMNTQVDLDPETPTFVNGYLKWNCWESSAILDNATVVSIVVIPFYTCTSRENSCSKSLPIFGIVKLLNYLPN